jgi:glutamyl-tRNA synthetase
VRGPQHIDEASQSDPVLVRADGSYLYSFTSVVDDVAFAITHVIRGEDHVTNSGAQIQMFRALGAGEPTFAHLPLLVDAAGGGLSKRTGSLSVGELRERGIEALAVSALLARLGTADPVEPVTSLDALVATVDFARVGRAAARFSEDELAHLSARTLHLLPYVAVRDRLPTNVGETLWLAVRGNLVTLADAAAWAEVVAGPLAPVLEDPAFLGEAAARLPAEPWAETTWKEWTGAVSAATQRKGRALFHPLRLALTARETGPEMAKLLPLIGRAKAAARLRGQTA